MGIENVPSDGNHLILKAEFSAGKAMPEHYATCDAFVIMTKGKIVITIEGQKNEVSTGEIFKIPANKTHILEVIDDFKAYIIMKPDGEIKYTGND